MQADQLEHPNVAELQAFALGKSGPEDLDRVQSHLRECPSCCERLEYIGDDTFVALLRDVDTVPNEKTTAPSIDEPPDPVSEIVPSEDETTDGDPVAETPTLSKERPATDSADAATVPPSVVSISADVPGDASPTAAYTAGLDDGVSPPALFNHPRFEVLELIGQGGMGAVYKAEHRHMKRTVALKVINPQLVAGQSAVERFRREVEAAARLHHPNIVTAFDAELAGDAHFLVMEYVPGTDLHDVLQQRGPLPVAEACDYIRQAAFGLQTALENGMVHRDIKPQNLMLTPDGQVKILDFGLASLTAEVVAPETIAEGLDSADSGEQQHSSLTQAGSIMGTPDYMAPEQARDAHTADIRADIYSLGCTLYALLTGNAPFTGGTAVDKIVAHAEHAPKPLREYRKDLPWGLAEVLNRMLAKHPAERYQTPAEVAEALERFSDSDAPGAPVSDRTINTPADGLIVAASIAFLTAIGCLLYWRFATGALLIAHPWDSALQFMSLYHIGYAIVLSAAAMSLRSRRARTAVLTAVAVIGIALPTVAAANFLMERLSFWPLMLPQWLGIPVCIWAVSRLVRDDVRNAFVVAAARARFGGRHLLRIAGVPAAMVLLGGVIWVTTNKGQLKVDSKVDDVRIVVSQDGEEIEVLDLKTGTTLKRLPSGDYKIAVKGDRNDVKLSKGTVTISRWGKTIVTLTAVPPPAAISVDRTEFNRVVAAGREKLTPRLKQQLQAEVHPVLGQLADPNTKPIIELFANLPDDAHQRLLKNGYLKWKYASLDAARQKVFQDNIKANIELAKQRGMPIPATISLKALAKADVGFAVVKIPVLKTAVVSWYILLPEYPQPMWVTVVGVQATGKQPYFTAHHEQLAKLRAKGYSKAIVATGSSPQRWVQLFNGKDLTGWHVDKKFKDGWKVVGGILKGQFARHDKPTWEASLQSDRGNYRDYHLRIKARVAAGGNGGVFFRHGPNPKAKTWSSYEADLPSSGSLPIGSLRRNTGLLLATAPAAGTPKPGEWFTLEVIARGERIKILVNGRTTAEVTDSASLEGLFALQSWGKGSVEFEKIEIMELSQTVPATEDGWVQLFNGKDLTGWKPHPNWRVKDGVLIGSGPVRGKFKQSMLFSERNDFADYHLRMEVRLLGAASDSGIFIRGNRKGSYCEANIGFKERFGSLAIRRINSQAEDPWIYAPSGLVKRNEWVVLEIIARGQHVITKVNGVTAAETRNAGVAPRGHINLQQKWEKTVVQFRKVEIKELHANPDFDALQKQSEAWLKLMDDGKYGECWEQSAAPNKKGISKADMIKVYTQVAAKFGKVTSRKLFSRDYVTELPGFPKGRYVLIKYLTDFNKQPGMVQSILLIPEDGTWKVQAHVLMPKDQLPVPKKKKQAQPTDYDRLTGTWSPIDATFSAKKLTKEQLLQTRFNFDGDRVELTFPNSPTLKTRYALRQTQKPKWIEFINPDPKKDGEPNIAGIYEFDGDKLKIAFGDADHARPRDFKPLKRQDHFVGTFVRADRPTTPELKVLSRSSGTWDSSWTENPTQRFKRKVTSRHRMRSNWILGNRFQQSYTTAVENDEEWLMLRTWDKARGVYRNFLFGSTGVFFERRSRWDAGTATMKHTLVPPAPGITGTFTEQFTDSDSLSFALRVKDARGQLTRNVDGIARRTLVAAPTEPKISKGPAAGNSQLAWLGKFAGRWNVQHEMRKSVLVPQPFTQQMTETVDWILGGRFLRARVVDRFGRLFAMYIMTWDSGTKTYRIWRFERDGSISLWKGARDDKRRTFDWQALDTPPGWIGTVGSCQIVDENKTILSIRVKDAQDRALLDMRHTRTRMKSK